MEKTDFLTVLIAGIIGCFIALVIFCIVGTLLFTEMIDNITKTAVNDAITYAESSKIICNKEAQGQALSIEINGEKQYCHLEGG